MSHLGNTDDTPWPLPHWLQTRVDSFDKPLLDSPNTEALLLLSRLQGGGSSPLHSLKPLPARKPGWRHTEQHSPREQTRCTLSALHKITLCRFNGTEAVVWYPGKSSRGKGPCYVSKVLWVLSQGNLTKLALHASQRMEVGHCCYTCWPDGKGSPQGLVQLRRRLGRIRPPGQAHQKTLSLSRRMILHKLSVLESWFPGLGNDLLAFEHAPVKASKTVGH